MLPPYGLTKDCATASPSDPEPWPCAHTPHTTPTQVAVVEGVRDRDEGLAVMNRLRKAATRVLH